MKKIILSVFLVSLAVALSACGGGGGGGGADSSSQDVNNAGSLFISSQKAQAVTQAATCSTVDYNGMTIAAGWYHTVGLKEDGTVAAVGHNGRGQLNVSSWTNIKSVVANGYQTVGLKEDGTVMAVGYNGYGQLNVSSWTNIKAVAAGWYHTVGLKEDGTVAAVGNNDYGQLNVSSWTNRKAVAAGAYHTGGLKEDGTVADAGHNGYGQLNVSSWTNIKAVAEGGYHTVGLKEDGTVAAVGNNDYGQLNTSAWSNIKQPTCMDSLMDKTPPELDISVIPGMLWPPNHKMVTVTPVISVKDNLDPAPQVKLLSATSNEPDNGLGDGDTENDIVINSDGTLSLRAERSGYGSGRIYRIMYQATDAAGNAATATATVMVPYNK